VICEGMLITRSNLDVNRAQKLLLVFFSIP